MRLLCCLGSVLLCFDRVAPRLVPGVDVWAIHGNFGTIALSLANSLARGNHGCALLDHDSRACLVGHGIEGRCESCGTPTLRVRGTASAPEDASSRSVRCMLLCSSDAESCRADHIQWEEQPPTANLALRDQASWAHLETPCGCFCDSTIRSSMPKLTLAVCAHRFIRLAGGDAKICECTRTHSNNPATT